MSRFDFRSPGAAASDAVTDYFDRLIARNRADREEAERRVARQEAAERQRMQDQRQTEQDRQAAEDRGRKIAREDSAASAAANKRGMDAMTADVVSQPGSMDDQTFRRQLAANFIREGFDVPDYLKDAVSAPPAPKRVTVDTVDERGRPVKRSVDEAELERGVPTYQQPREPRDQSRMWVLRNGEPVRVTEENIRPGDRPYNGGSNDKPTQSQLTADTFYSRATDALDAIDEVEESIGAWDLVAPNFMQTGAGQQYTQAKRQFVEAYLRKDSGAAIGKEEFANADKAYFPQVGDSATTRRRKRAAREKIAESLQHQGSNQGGNGSGAPMRPMPSHGTRPTAAELIKKYGS